MRLNIPQKGILLIGITLLMEILFISMLTILQNQAQETAVQARNSRNIVLALESLNQLSWQAGRNIAYFGLSGDDKFNALAKDTIKKIDTKLPELNKLPVHSSEQKENLKNYQENVRIAISQMKSLLESGEISEPVSGAIYKNVLFYRLNEAATISQKITDYEFRRREKYPEEEKRARELVSFCIYAGVGANVLICLGLATFFTFDISSRLNKILENTELLKNRQPLNDYVGGVDEIAVLDREFHDMAELIVDALEKETAIFENVAELILTMDSELVFTRVSPSVRAILGYDPGSMVEQNIFDYVPRDDMEKVQDLFKQTASEENVETRTVEELQILRSDDQYAWTKWTILWSPLKKTYFCVVSDITTEKNIEQVKQDFTNMVSHDLRTPLTALSGTLELIETGKYGDMTEKGLIRVGQAKLNLKRMLSLINELLDLEKMKSGQLSLALEEVEASDIAQSAIDLVQGFADLQSIKLNLELNTEAIILADPTRLTQVIQNLLSNALKFSPENSTITVILEEDDRQVCFKVIDEGPGLSLEDQQLVFDRFYQSQNKETSKVKGTGLGLAFCRSLVELHGGTIGVESKIGSGSTFYVNVNKVI